MLTLFRPCKLTYFFGSFFIVLLNFFSFGIFRYTTSYRGFPVERRLYFPFHFGTGSYGTDFFLFIFFSLLLIVLLAVACNLWANKKQAAIISILHDQCDPEAYLAAYLPLVDRKRVTKKFNNFNRVNVSAGYIAKDDLVSGMALLTSTYIDGVSLMERITNCVKFNNLAAIYLRQGDLESACNCINQFQFLLGQVPVSYRSRPQLVQSYQVAYHTYLFYQGQVEVAKQFFENALHFAKNNYQKCETVYMLANIYLALGQPTKARDAFYFVATNGNKLAIAEKSKVKLAEMAARSQARAVPDSAVECTPPETPIGETSSFAVEPPAASSESQGPAEGFTVSPTSPSAEPLQSTEGTGEEGKL